MAAAMPKAEVVAPAAAAVTGQYLEVALTVALLPRRWDGGGGGW